MNLSVAFIKSAEKFALRNFKNEEKAKLLDIDELTKSDYQFLVYPESLNEESLLVEKLKDIKRSIPIKSEAELNMNIEQADTLSSDDMTPIVKRAYESWVINNNIELLHNLFPTLNHLKALWPNDRTAFFEEFWFTLKRNLGPGELKVIYNDIKKAQKEGAKDELIQVRIEGDKIPNPFEGSEFEAKIMEEYNKYFSSNFEIVEYSKDSGQLVFTCQINQSPVIVMATPFNFSKLQASLLKALIDGLNV